MKRLAMWAAMALLATSALGHAADKAVTPAKSPVTANQQANPSNAGDTFTLTAAAAKQGCSEQMVSEDAASCSAGGWTALLTCCSAGGQALERWSKNGQIKCCGACFQLAVPEKPVGSDDG